MIRKYQSEDKDAVMALIDLNIPEYFDESERHDLKTTWRRKGKTTS